VNNTLEVIEIWFGQGGPKDLLVLPPETQQEVAVARGVELAYALVSDTYSSTTNPLEADGGRGAPISFARVGDKEESSRLVSFSLDSNSLRIRDLVDGQIDAESTSGVPRASLTHVKCTFVSRLDEPVFLSYHSQLTPAHVTLQPSDSLAVAVPSAVEVRYSTRSDTVGAVLYPAAGPAVADSGLSSFAPLGSLDEIARRMVFYSTPNGIEMEETIAKKEDPEDTTGGNPE
jgi:hypothetical protein